MTKAATAAATEEVMQTPQQVEAAADADLDAGFKKVQGEKLSPDSTTTPKAAEEGTQQAVNNTATDATVTAEATATEAVTEEPGAKAQLIAGMTEDELKAALAKGGEVEQRVAAEVRKVYSKIGEINRNVQELTKKLSTGTASRKFTSDMLKRVSDELPGLGEALAADLNAIFDSPQAAAEQQQAQAAAEAQGKTFDPEAYFAEKLAPALQAFEARANEKAELRIVKSVHRDFETVVKSPEFGTWLQTLPAERQKEVRESEDGFVAADAVTEFKDWKEKAAKKAAGKKERLENAITPQGSGAPPVRQVNDEEADFASGFKKGLKR